MDGLQTWSHWNRLISQEGTEPCRAGRALPAVLSPPEDSSSSCLDSGMDALQGLSCPLLSGLTPPWSSWPMSSLSLCRAQEGGQEGSPRHRYVLGGRAGTWEGGRGCHGSWDGARGCHGTWDGIRGFHGSWSRIRGCHGWSSEEPTPQRLCCSPRVTHLL